MITVIGKPAKKVSEAGRRALDYVLGPTETTSQTTTDRQYGSPDGTSLYSVTMLRRSFGQGFGMMKLFAGRPYVISRLAIPDPQNVYVNSASVALPSRV